MQVCNATATLEAVTAGNALGHALLSVHGLASCTVLAKAGTQREHCRFWYPFAHHYIDQGSVYLKCNYNLLLRATAMLRVDALMAQILLDLG